MSKFNTTTVRPAVHSPIVGDSQPTGSTFEGAPGYARSTQSELFLLAVHNMVGEDTFYERGGARDDRYTQLIHQATVQDPEWTGNMLRWLRGPGNMRSAALVGAAEFVVAALTNQIEGGRQVVASVLQRGDEPGEMLAYWTSKHGRRVPKPVKRGAADAVARLYNEKSLLKYDAPGKGFRFGDVLELVHAENTTNWQGDLFRHAIDRRHNRNNPIPESLGVLRNRETLMAIPVERRREYLNADTLLEAGMTWESLAGWLQSPMDAQAWEAVIPTMGYMALLRNLRNFDQAEVSDTVAAQVAATLTDPEQVAKSRQLPMRFLSAYQAAPSLRWSYPLEQALNHCLVNVPTLKGRTLILVDRSGSMWSKLSERSELNRADAAAIFGTVLASRAQSADLVQFGTDSAPVQLDNGESVLRAISRFGELGGTNTTAAVQRWFNGHDRVVIVTDEQAHYSYHGNPTEQVPDSVPVYTWNLAGYKHGHAPSGSGQRHTFGGLSDQAFRMIPLLEAGRDATWPWQAA